MNFNESIECNDIIKNAVTDYLKKMDDFEIGEGDEEQLRKKYDARIRAKLQAGKRLTSKEMKYLKKYNPELYIHAIRIEAKRKAVEQRLKHADSKQEVSDVQMQAVTTIAKNDPVREYMLAAVHDTIKEFKESDEYKLLPETDNDKRMQKKYKNNSKLEVHTESSNKLISYEFGLDAYQMAYVHDVSDKSLYISG